MNHLWQYPQKLWQWPLFMIGFLLFWLLTPYWLWIAIYKWKEDALFLYVHWKAMFYNPWIIAEELIDEMKFRKKNKQSMKMDC